jgi:hypothetical protein
VVSGSKVAAGSGIWQVLAILSAHQQDRRVQQKARREDVLGIARSGKLLQKSFFPKLMVNGALLEKGKSKKARIFHRNGGKEMRVQVLTC